MDMERALELIWRAYGGMEGLGWVWRVLGG